MIKCKALHATREEQYGHPMHSLHYVSTLASQRGIIDKDILKSDQQNSRSSNNCKNSVVLASASGKRSWTLLSESPVCDDLDFNVAPLSGVSVRECKSCSAQTSALPLKSGVFVLQPHSYLLLDEPVLLRARNSEDDGLLDQIACLKEANDKLIHANRCLCLQITSLQDGNLESSTLACDLRCKLDCRCCVMAIPIPCSCSLVF